MESVGGGEELATIIMVDHTNLTHCTDSIPRIHPAHLSPIPCQITLPLSSKLFSHPSSHLNSLLDVSFFTLFSQLHPNSHYPFGSLSSSPHSSTSSSPSSSLLFHLFIFLFSIHSRLLTHGLPPPGVNWCAFSRVRKCTIHLVPGSG